ncbi:cysteine-rich CWC family protein [Neobacillus drentensis]|uniref:cysteine-rich CWC family protein n=1 Tax=Neobacillus drentensis TaxID=220684 RepID=UPI0030029153
MANKHCPICGEERKCIIGSGGHGDCWCYKEIFPDEIFESVLAESRRKHCICKNCLNKFKEEQTISKINPHLE